MRRLDQAISTADRLLNIGELSVQPGVNIAGWSIETQDS
jgi:hypothetical protein